jgi:anti-anti-sigma regulatory factor
MENNSVNKKRTTLTIENSLTIYDVGLLKEKALEILGKSNFIEVNLDTVCECDTAGIQLLYSLKKSAKESGKELIINNPSRSVEDALKRAEMPVGMIISN